MADQTRTISADIRAFLESWAAATRRKDAAAFLAHVSPDCTTFSMAPPLTAPGTDADGLQAWFDSWRGPLDYRFSDPVITVDGNLALCHGLVYLGGEKVGGSTDTIWYRQTLGLKRLAGAWKIVHQHDSVPFYMDGSLQAAVDLDPDSTVEWDAKAPKAPGAGAKDV